MIIEKSAEPKWRVETGPKGRKVATPPATPPSRWDPPTGKFGQKIVLSGEKCSHFHPNQKKNEIFNSSLKNVHVFYP